MQQAIKDYELYFILNPLLNKDQLADEMKKVSTVLTNCKAEVTDSWGYGLKNLAYAIDGKNSGFVETIQFSGLPQTIKTLEIELKRNEKVMRFLTTALDKHAVKYNAERKQKRLEAVDAKQATEASE